MKDSHTIRDFADAVIGRKMQALDLLFPYYDDRVREKIFRERDFVWSVAESFDRAFGDLFDRCIAAKNPSALISEMQRLRIRGLHFLSFLHTSRRVLLIASRRLKIQAKLDGIESELQLLGVELNISEVDDLLRVADELLRRPPKKFTRTEELRLFLRTILLPLESRAREGTFGRAGRNYATAIREMISASTKSIYKAQALGLATVIWRVVQPTIVPLIGGFVIMYLIHATLESGGLHFLHIDMWVVLSIAAVYLVEKIIERVFEHWHLERYRRACARTALSLFLAEIRARSAVLGLIVLSETELKGLKDG